MSDPENTQHPSPGPTSVPPPQAGASSEQAARQVQAETQARTLVDAPESTSDDDTTGSTMLELGVPFLIAVALTLGWILFLGRLDPDLRLREMFDGIIQHVTVFLLLWHVGVMAMRWYVVLKPERRVMRETFLPPGMHEIDREIVIAAATKAHGHEQRHRSTMLTRRLILSATNLAVRGDEDAMSTMLQRRAESDRQRADEAYAIPNFIFWAIPIIGFIGTVVGIGIAIAGLGGDEVESAAALRDQIGGVAGALGMAFDTTQVALMLSVVALLVQTLVNRSEMRLHDQLEDHLTFRLESRLAGKGRANDQLQLFQALRGLAKRLHEDGQQREQAHRTYLSSMASGHDAIAEALQSLPKHLGGVPEAMQGGMAQIEQQMEHLVRQMGENITPLISDMREQLTAIARDVGQQLQQVAGDLGRQMGEERAAVMEQARQSASSAIREGVEPLVQGLQAYAARSESLMAQVEQLRQLERAVADGLQSAGNGNQLQQVLSGMQHTLATIVPALDRLQDPVPVRLSLVGIEAAGGLQVNPEQRG